MIGLANGRYDILRGSGVNEYGDEIDEAVYVSRDNLGSILERSSKVYNPTDSRIEVIRYYVGRFKTGTDIRPGDRIEDTQTSVVYLVDSVDSGNSLVHKSDVVVELLKN